MLGIRGRGHDVVEVLGLEDTAHRVPPGDPAPPAGAGWRWVGTLCVGARVCHGRRGPANPQDRVGEGAVWHGGDFPLASSVLNRWADDLHRGRTREVGGWRIRRGTGPLPAADSPLTTDWP